MTDVTDLSHWLKLFLPGNKNSPLLLNFLFWENNIDRDTLTELVLSRAGEILCLQKKDSSQAKEAMFNMVRLN